MDQNCYLCHEQFKTNRYKFKSSFLFKHTIVCPKCQAYVEQFVFMGCPRCSSSKCTGCENLSVFQHVHCLYRYHDIFSKILVGSKDLKQIILINIFYDLFFYPVYNQLKSLLEHKNFDAIFLAPYRRGRLINAYWHTNLFYEDVFNQLKQEIPDSKIPIQSFFKSEGPKKSLYRKFLLKNKENNNKNLIFFHDYTKNPLQEKISKKPTYLICDDVLTTGDSSIKFTHNFNTNNVDLNLFTLFRSHQSH